MEVFFSHKSVATKIDEFVSKSYELDSEVTPWICRIRINAKKTSDFCKLISIRARNVTVSRVRWTGNKGKASRNFELIPQIVPESTQSQLLSSSATL